MQKILGGVAVIEQNGKHFLIKQSKYKKMPGLWRHPGGTFKQGESPKREIKEELDIDNKLKSADPEYVAKNDYKNGYFGFYKAKMVKGMIVADSDEIADYGWFTIKEAKKLNLMKATREYYNDRYLK